MVYATTVSGKSLSPLLADILLNFDPRKRIHIFITNKFFFREVAAGRWSFESIRGRFRKSREN